MSRKKKGSGCIVLVFCGIGALACCCIAPAFLVPTDKRASREPVGQKAGDRVHQNEDERLAARFLVRAKAEADAEERNEFNRRAHADEVKRLTALHEVKLEEYKADLEAFTKAEAEFKKAKVAYRLDKAEFDAALEMNIARVFFDDKNFNVARRRFREIIAKYPDTPTAKDAQYLLDDGYVAPRATPLRPVYPVAPVAPVEPRLVLPPEPQPVAVVYPDEQEIVPVAQDIPVTQLAMEKDIPGGDFVPTRSGAYQTPVRLASGKTVYVRGYFRANGTYVAPHTRSEPGTASNGGGTVHTTSKSGSGTVHTTSKGGGTSKRR
jgi:hypothetical protein